MTASPIAKALVDSAPWLLDHAPYVPFMEKRTAHPPGLVPIDPAELTVELPDFGAQVAHRDRLVAERAAIVLGLEPAAREAALELLDALVAHQVSKGARLAPEGEHLVRRDGVAVPLDRDDPMRAIARLGAEDWCILMPGGPGGEYVLRAGALCFPARWILAEKMGKPLTAIHDPVPDYGDDLARRVNRIFDAIRVDRPMYRVNWLVYDTPEPHLPRGVAEKKHYLPDPSKDLFLRTERQTLHRLPGTGAVIFGIKTSLTPLACLSADEAMALADGLEGFDAATVSYRGGAPYLSRVASVLREIAGQGRGEAASLPSN
ncbi:DUF3445 domain-containing protein [Limibaculum sp. M0105]|uniref:DUF3445 domain-containing protein n=1 Tax=Thermohalobaculum xanthum TaxID=2753746 RepID=A0A8J7M766_9RHOB|nr:DUF3445 domain-containing protein [Thermohalobaculum xanthum]MBK0398799.1 DUF3445 domain-containing protein [Thermohalobaculum xanthum]